MQQDKEECQIREMIQDLSAWPLEGHHLHSEPSFGPTSKTPSGPHQPSLLDLQVKLNVNGLKTQLCVDTAETVWNRGCRQVLLDANVNR